MRVVDSSSTGCPFSIESTEAVGMPDADGSSRPHDAHSQNRIAA
jgi:hypothetical protein